MKESLLLVSLLAATAPAAGQDRPLVVSDLVEARTPRAAPPGHGFVTRTFGLEGSRDWLDPQPGWEGKFAWHTIAGSGPFLDSRPGYRSNDDDDDDAPRLSEAALIEALAALGGISPDALEVRHRGRIARLHAADRERAASALAALRDDLPAPVRIELRLERIDHAGRSTVLVEGSQRSRDGGLVLFGDATYHVAPRDYDVEIAAGAASVNPVPSSYTRGATVAVRARPLPFHEAAVVETLVRAARSLPSEPIVPDRTLDPVDRLKARVDEAAFAVRLDRGARSVHEWTDRDGATLRLTLAGDWPARQPARPARPRIVATDPFRLPVRGFRYRTRRGSSDARDEQRLIDVLAAAEPDAATYVQGNHRKGGVLVVPPGDEGEALRHDARRRLDDALHPVRAHLEVLDVPRGVEFGEGDALPAGARVVARVDSALLADLPVCFGSAEEQSFLPDHDVEVAQATRATDPKFAVVEDGWFVTLTAHRDPQGRLAALQVELDVEELQSLERAELRLNDPTVGTLDSHTTTVVLPADVVYVEKAREARVRLTTALELDAEGRARHARSATSLLGTDRRLVLRARVQ